MAHQYPPNLFVKSSMMQSTGTISPQTGKLSMGSNPA